MFFDDSRPERRKKANRGYEAREARQRALVNSPIPAAKPVEFLTDEELYFGGHRTFTFDVESYPNYFLVSFKCVETGKYVYFEDSPNALIDRQKLHFLMLRNRVVGFNSADYDMVMVELAIHGLHAAELYDVTQQIIVENVRSYQIEKDYGCRLFGMNHIDLIEVAPLDASLKIYGGRLHCERMQELPYPVGTYLTQEQAANVRDYNFNDLDETERLFLHLSPQIALREEIGKEYGLDLRSKSDAQVAETVISKELEKIGAKGKRPTIPEGWAFKYVVPSYMQFRTPQFQRVLDAVRDATFYVGASGSADLPPELAALDIRLGNCVYRLGIGGLHSSEKSVGYVTDDEFVLIDRDVASYYPAIILNQGLFPQHLGPAFLQVYRDLVNRRLGAKLAAKKFKDLNQVEQAAAMTVAADALKITINGAFGKLGNQYSALYSPDLLTQVTMTGQLSLLMYIEMAELTGIPVVSANTDGVVFRCPVGKVEELNTVSMMWENATGFVTEETRYKALYSRDVNNYIAIKEDGECKTKGVYSEVGSALNSPLSKNPENYIVSMALQEFLSKGVPVAETVLNRGRNVKTKHYTTEVSRFVTVRTVKGGAEKAGVYLGKAVRWYYAVEETGEFNYVLSGNKVPKTDGAKPLMEMSDVLPNDLDFDKYINEAEDALYDVGYYKRPETQSLF